MDFHSIVAFFGISHDNNIFLFGFNALLWLLQIKNYERTNEWMNKCRGLRNSGLPTRIMMWNKAVTFLQRTRTCGVCVFSNLDFFLSYKLCKRYLCNLFSCLQVPSNFNTVVRFSLQQLNRIVRWWECIQLSLGAVRRRTDWNSPRLVLGQRSAQWRHLEDSEIQHSLYIKRVDTAKCLWGNWEDRISSDSHNWSLVAGFERSLPKCNQVHRRSAF